MAATRAMPAIRRITPATIVDHRLMSEYGDLFNISRSWQGFSCQMQISTPEYTRLGCSLKEAVSV